MKKLNKTIEQLKRVFISLDAKGNKNESLEEIFLCIKKVVSKAEPLRFLLFTCSVINANKLFSSKPWLYIKLNLNGNNLEPDLFFLKNILTKLNKIYPVEVIVIIGNTDPYYIYLQQFKNFTILDRKILWNKFSKRWSRYKYMLERKLITELGSRVRVVSWYEIEKETEIKYKVSFEKEYQKTRARILRYFSKRELDWELAKLKNQFGPGKYFENLTCPPEKLLKDWVKRKFAEYAVQGKWLYKYFPNAILIQNEKPSELRSRMYQPLIKEEYGDKLPIVYFFGIDNSGFR